MREACAASFDGRGALSAYYMRQSVARRFLRVAAVTHFVHLGRDDTVVAPSNASPRTEPAFGPRGAIAYLQTVTRAVTIEQCAWIALLVSAILTRFWNLGARALHHDESLHAWFSYQYAI